MSYVDSKHLFGIELLTLGRTVKETFKLMNPFISSFTINKVIATKIYSQAIFGTSYVF